MRAKRSFRGVEGAVLTLMLLAGCAARGRNAPLGEVEPRDYSRSIVARDQQLSGGIAVLSSPAGDVLFIAKGSVVDELDGETGTLRRRHSTPLPSIDNIVHDGNRLVLISSRRNQVVVWDPATDVVAEEHDGFALPVNAARFDGALMVVEQQRGSIARQERGATTADTFVTGMRAPTGLTATARDLWVADWASGTILQVVADHRPLAEPIEIASGLSQPEGLAVTPDAGALIVAETGADRLLRVNPKMRTVQVLDERLGFDHTAGSGMNPSGRFAGIAIGACGTIYVTADRSGEVLRYAPKGPLTCTYGE